MAIGVFRVNIGIIVYEIFIACIIGRINVNNINFTRVSICESRKGFQIVARRVRDSLNRHESD